MKLDSAKILSLFSIRLEFDAAPSRDVIDAVSFFGARIRSAKALGKSVIFATDRIDVSNPLTIQVHEQIVVLTLEEMLGSLYSDKELGCVAGPANFVFRLFAPRAESVRVHLYAGLDTTQAVSINMVMDEMGVWEATAAIDVQAMYYTFSLVVKNPDLIPFLKPGEFADPYGRVITTQNSFLHKGRTLLRSRIPDFDWQNDRPVPIAPEDLIVYEMHVADMTKHPSAAGLPAQAGSYADLIDPGVPGGLAHIRSLGVNAVELLPCQQYGYFELPYKVITEAGDENFWNPYERNHWGYMTSYFFTPEPRYASNASAVPGEWNDVGVQHVREFKEMVKAFHRAGIAVIMDVVYNHTSQYDDQPFKHIDPQYYYNFTGEGKHANESGCGNDLNSSRPMARKLIIDSICHWIREYHVDGFRFDLAALLDDTTLTELAAAAKRLNPDVILIAEPWGGSKHNLHRFSGLGYSSWNDIFRNGVKGSVPDSFPGYIFGTWGGSSPESFGKWILGSVVEKEGPFLQASHSVNYLESHDGYTLGDFVRIACGEIPKEAIITNTDAAVRLTEKQMRVHTLAACMLFFSKGVVMMAEGQEFARSKVAADVGVQDRIPGKMDENSYEKDDTTNWLNFNHARINSRLVEFYKGLIAIRKKYASLRRAPWESYTFLIPDADLASGFIIDDVSAPSPRIIVLINPNTMRDATYIIPPAGWRVLVRDSRAGLEPLELIASTTVIVPKGTAMMMVEDRPEEG